MNAQTKPATITVEIVAKVRRKTGMPILQCKRYLEQLSPEDYVKFMAAIDSQQDGRRILHDLARSRAPAIADFPLAWRWTRATHAQFSPAELASLHPFSPAEAERIRENALQLLRDDSLDPGQFQHIVSHSAAESVAETCLCLRAHQPNLSERVTLSWVSEGPHVALQTSWLLFTARWDDFCYPSSDDLFVLPESGGWVLLYRHWDTFYFANRPT